jgi:rhomboid protease GluP
MKIEKKLRYTYLSFPRFKNGALWALGLVTLCIIMSFLYWSHYDFAKEMNAHTKAIFLDKDYFKLITSVFIHGDLGHLLSNSLMLFILSYFVTSFYGYPVLILITLIIGPLINLCVLTLKSTSLSIVGISGVIYTLWGFWLIQYLLIDLRTSLVRRLVNIIGIFLILLIPTSYNPQTSYLAHYIGFVFGVLYSSLYYKIHKQRFIWYQFYEIKYIEDLEQD